MVRTFIYKQFHTEEKCEAKEKEPLIVFINCKLKLPKQLMEHQAGSFRLYEPHVKLLS